MPNEPIRNIDLTGYSPEQRAVIEEALHVMADRLHWDHDAIAQEIKHDWSTVTRFCQGKPQGDIDGVIAAFAQFAARIGPVAFVRNPFVDDWLRVLNSARRDGKMGVIVARNGRGKSTTLREWNTRHPRANGILFQCPSICTRSDLVELIARAARLKIDGEKRPRWEKYLLSQLTPRQMLIVDEAGYLIRTKAITAPMRLLQDINDQCGCPIVMAMRPDQWDTLMDEQLLGRILHRSIVKCGYKIEEIEPILRSYAKDGISAKLRQAVKILLDREIGGIRALFFDLAEAADFAKAEKVAFDEAFISQTSLRDKSKHLERLEDFC